MRILYIKPYSLYIVEEGVCYKIMRYNVLSQDWDELPDVYNNKEDAKAEIDRLNSDSGLVTYMIE